MATLGKEMKNLRPELQEYRGNAVEGNLRKVDPNQKRRQIATRICNYCRTNGHAPSWCRKKIRDEELKRIENERTAEKKRTFTQDYKKNEKQTMDRNNGLEAKTCKEDIRTTITMNLGEIPPLPIRIYLRGHFSHMGTTIRTMEDHMINAQMSHLMETMEIDHERDLSTIRTGTGATTAVIPVLHRLKGSSSHKKIHITNREVINLTILPSTDLTIDS